MGGQQGKDVTNGSVKRKSGDKKKTTQNLKKDDQHHDSDSLDSVNNNKRWSSEENLDSSFDGDDNENLFVALYDFQSGASDQLDLVKGDKVIVLEHNESNEWSMVEKKNGPVSTSGWVPTNFIASASSYNKFSWFHGPLSRNAAEYLLSSGITGSFLVRDSESCPGQLTLSLRFEEKYLHYRIQRDFDMVFVADEQRFPSLSQLIKFYSKEPGLATLLQFAVRKVNKPPIFALSPEMEKWEVDRNELEMKQQLGSGQYGDVYEAVWKKYKLQVAIKTLRAESTALEDFKKEVTVMKEMKHKNLVQLLDVGNLSETNSNTSSYELGPQQTRKRTRKPYTRWSREATDTIHNYFESFFNTDKNPGICTLQPPYYIITEYMSQGNLLDYLRSSSPEELGLDILFYMATQIASAMGYLEKMNFIHRDLAARNCLVGEHHLVKVADFGLARLVPDETYTAQSACKFPIKWTAPEGLMYGTFSTKSDVWAFGVLLWELATYGETPYPSIELQDVYQFVERGCRMTCPPGCPSVVYDLMLQCWKWEPGDRPTFHNIHDNLNTLKKFEELELKLGGNDTKPAVAHTVASGNSHKESVPVTPPLFRVPKPNDFLPVQEARLPAAAVSGQRKPPMPPKKDFNLGDGTDPRSLNDNVVSNRTISHQYSLDESKPKGHKTQVNEAKSLPPKPTVSPGVLGAAVGTLRKPADVPKPSLNDEQLSEIRSSLRKLSNPPETSKMKPVDASGTKCRTMPHEKSGTNFEILSHGKFLPKKKAHSTSEAELESNPADSQSGKHKQLAKPLALSLAEILESNRPLGDASISGSSAGPQNTVQGKKLPAANRPKPPITGPKPTVLKLNTETTITPL